MMPVILTVHLYCHAMFYSMLKKIRVNPESQKFINNGQLITIQIKVYRLTDNVTGR